LLHFSASIYETQKPSEKFRKVHVPETTPKTRPPGFAPFAGRAIARHLMRNASTNTRDGHGPLFTLGRAQAIVAHFRATHTGLREGDQLVVP
jgi:hypothetical protein